MEAQYLQVLQQIHQDGNFRKTRNGTTQAVFAPQLRHDLRNGFPLLTTKQVAWKMITAELLWFLEAGRNSTVPFRMSNIRFRELLGYKPEQKTIWSHDEEKPEWQKRAQFPGDCGRIYGAQWRNWNGRDDQIAKLIHLLRTDPSSRYMKVTAWNPSELSEMCLPPCHGDFQCFVSFAGKEKLLSLHMNQRSCDMFLGVPFNIASYALLLHMLAHVTGMVPHELVITLNDAHIYDAHKEAVSTQLVRTPSGLPAILLNPDVKEIDDFTMNDVRILNYSPQGKIEAPLL